MVNDMTNSEGRLCNQIIKALAASFISEKQNLKFNYGIFFDKICFLGIKLFTEGTMIYRTEQKITDNNIMSCISTPIFRNINVNDSYFQIKAFSNYLYNYYKQEQNQESIIKANKFNIRYKNNNDVFIHIRLGDVTEYNPGFEYYDKVLSQITFENGYISSDSIDNEICKKLIQKHSLKIIDYNEVETIMFGSTCKYIILGGGSFSYIIGLFGFFSDIYYTKGGNKWYPDELYMIDDWHEIKIKTT